MLPREELAINRPLKLANPLSRQWEYARTTLRHSLLQTLAANIRGSQELLSLFETARVYMPREDDLPHEIESLCGVVSGRDCRPLGHADGRRGRLLRGESVCWTACSSRCACGRSTARRTTSRTCRAAPPRCLSATTPVGLIGEVHPRVCAEFDIPRPVAMFEVDLEALLPHVPGVRPLRAGLAVPAGRTGPGGDRRRRRCRPGASSR